jgi:RNA polymerase sigma-70 factor (ECF subfamily)
VPTSDFVDLLARVRDRDERAFADLWRRYQPLVLRYARVLAGDGADDIASEAWIAVLRSMDRFVGDEQDFRRWLVTIVRHRAMDWGRSRQRDRTTPREQDQLEDAGLPAPDTASLVVDSISATEAVALIERTLPPLQAEAVILRSVIGLDVPEVAKIMNKRAGAVRVLTHRGLRSLEELFRRSENVQRR